MWVVVVTLLAAFGCQTGMFLWKLASPRLRGLNPRKPLHLLLRLFSNRIWLAGYVCGTLGWVLFIYATNIGSISLVQPLMSIGDVYLVLLAFFVLGERLRGLEWWGLALTIFGAALLATTVTHSDSVPLVWESVVKFFVFALAAGTMLFVLKNKFRSQEVLLATAVGTILGCASVATKLMTIYVNTRHMSPTALEFILNPRG